MAKKPAKTSLLLFNVIDVDNQNSCFFAHEGHFPSPFGVLIGVLDRYCPRLNRSGSFLCNTTNQTLQSKTNINCQTMNCIYLITCSSCGIQYLGQTKNKLLTRFNSHFYDISHNSDTTVARHFNKCPRLKPAMFDLKLHPRPTRH